MAVHNVRAWLMRKPQPARLTTDDGTEIAVGRGRSKWSDAEKNIAEIQPAVVKALDAGGRVLRILNFQDDGLEVDDDKPRIRVTNEHDRDIKIAEIIARVSDASAMRHEAAYSKAFEKMGFLVELLVRRLTSAENQVARLQHALEVQATQVAEETGADRDDVMSQMIQGLLMKGFLEANNGKPNGKANGKANGAPNDGA